MLRARSGLLINRVRHGLKLCIVPMVLVSLGMTLFPSAPWALSPEPLPSELTERVIPRLAVGDAEGAAASLKELGAAIGPELMARYEPVVGAASGDLALTHQLLERARQEPGVGRHLVVHAARSLSKSHPLVAALVADTVRGSDAAGRAASMEVASVLRRMWRPQEAGRVLAGVLGADPERRLRRVPAPLARAIPAQAELKAELERGLVLLDSRAYERALSAFQGLLSQQLDQMTRCWALWGAVRAGLRSEHADEAFRWSEPALVECPDHAMADKSVAWLARASFGWQDERSFHRLKAWQHARGRRGFAAAALGPLEGLWQAPKALDRLMARARTRMVARVHRDPLSALAYEAWQRPYETRRWEAAATVLEPVVAAGSDLRHPARRGQAAYWLARTWQAQDDSGKEAAAQQLWAQVAREHRTSWYGQMAASRLRLADRNLKDPLAPRTEGLASPGEGLPDPEWFSDDQAMSTAARMLALRDWGLVRSMADEAWLGGLTAHPGRGAWASALLHDSGATREGLRVARVVIEGMGWELPSQGSRALWRLAWPRPYRSLVESLAASSEVEPWLIWAVMRIESRYHPAAVSGAGARGLMQVMPGTARYLAPKLPPHEGPHDLFDPAWSIHLGAHFLARLERAFEGLVPLAVGAYNAGPGRMRGWLRKAKDAPLDTIVERLPSQQTRHYVRSVMHAWATYRDLYGSGDADALMAAYPTGLEVPEEAKWRDKSRAVRERQARQEGNARVKKTRPARKSRRSPR